MGVKNGIGHVFDHVLGGKEMVFHHVLEVKNGIGHNLLTLYNYRVWIHSETRTRHDTNIQSNSPHR